MNINFTIEKIRNIALVITSAAFFLVASFVLNPGFFTTRLNDEVFKLTYQFLLLVVIGGSISFLFTFYAKLREEQVRKKEQDDAKEKEKKLLQRKFYRDFIEAYNDGKKIRRFLRARTRKLQIDATDQQEVLLKTDRYDELMKELTVLQLKCESFYDEVVANELLFKAGNVKMLSQNLKSIEDYLNQIVSEYENCFTQHPNQSFIDEVQYLQLEKLSKLKEFISPYKEATCFKHQFKKAAQNVTEILLIIVTTPTPSE